MILCDDIFKYCRVRLQTQGCERSEHVTSWRSHLKDLVESRSTSGEFASLLECCDKNYGLLCQNRFYFNYFIFTLSFQTIFFAELLVHGLLQTNKQPKTKQANKQKQKIHWHWQRIDNTCPHICYILLTLY